MILDFETHLESFNEFFLDFRRDLYGPFVVYGASYEAFCLCLGSTIA